MCEATLVRIRAPPRALHPVLGRQVRSLGLPDVFIAFLCDSHSIPFPSVKVMRSHRRLAEVTMTIIAFGSS